MRVNRFRLRLELNSTIALLLLGAFLLVGLASLAQGQSGRRLPKRTEPKAGKSESAAEQGENAPAAKSAEEAKSAERASEAKRATPGLSFFIVNDSPDLYLPMTFPRYVVDGCAGRLDKFPGVTIKVGRDMNRKEAYDKAKAEKETYVLWLQIEQDRFTQRTSREIPEINVSYTVFTPGTGRTKSSGRVYLRPLSPTVGGVPVPLPRSHQPLEYLLQQAGGDVADRVMDSLDINVPSPRRYP